MFKKIFALLLTFSMVSGLPVFAAEEEYLYGEYEASFTDVVFLNQCLDSSFFSDDSTASSQLLAAQAKILDGVKNFNSSINIYEYKIPTDLFGSLCSYTFFYYPELFYINPTFRYSYSPSTGCIAEVYFSFGLTQSEYASRKTLFDKAVDEAISLTTSEMSDLEKALTIHDYLASHAEYDSEISSGTVTSADRPASYRADGILVNKVGVCQSYSMAYYYILNKLGIEIDYVESDTMNHIWNIVKIDGNWYHVDLTWDDPVTDNQYYVKHSNFLLSDELLGQSHSDYASNYECSDTSFDNSFWSNLTNTIACDGKGNAYYSEYNRGFVIKKYNFSSKSSSTLKSYSGEYWFVWGSSSQIYTSQWTSMHFFNGFLYFNTPTKIIEMSANGTDVSTIFSYTGNDGYIYGSVVNDGFLSFGIAQTPNEKCTEYVTALENKILVSDENALSVRLISKGLNYENISGNIIAVLYGSDDTVIASEVLKLSDYNIVSEETEIPISLSESNGKYIKLMWWDFSSLSPVSDSLKYNL